MQFHQNGFEPGDPQIHRAERALADYHSQLPEKVDVLIVGSGPAGLTLAAQLAAFPAIKTLLVEKNDGPLQRGRADGIACRSMEMFNAFGFAERLMRESYWVNETTFWKPDQHKPGNIARTGRIQDVEDGLSEFPHVILNQARVHDYFLEVMRQSPSREMPAYSRELQSLLIDDASADYPVCAIFKRLDNEQGITETVHARYVVGCDGARSMVRQSIGLKLLGDSANQAWGVMDILTVTDFPDIRMKSLIQSASDGSVLVIPREGGYLVRLYVELGKLNEDERVSARNITVEQLIDTANRIFSPYTLEVKEVAWWSVYEIGQRLCDRFDNVPEPDKSRQHPRIFIAGDACHTHSPKAGQGMNVSMRDAFNLGWKLAAVLRDQCKPELLSTYTDERQKVAQTLIDFDREWSAIISSRAKAGNQSDEAESARFQEYFVQSGRYTAGTAIQYQASMIIAEPAHQHLAHGLAIGTRFHSAPVIRLADAKPVQLGHTVTADGRWRLFAFADERSPADRQSAIHALCNYLQNDEHSPVQKYTREGGDIDSLFDVRAIFQQPFRDIELECLPALLLPRKGRFELIDYEKAFCADSKDGPDIYDARGIDREQGCVVIVRPDQHIAHVLPLDGFSAITAFFDRFMREP